VAPRPLACLRLIYRFLEEPWFEHRLVIEGVVEELYDVVALPGVIRPMALGFRSDEVRFTVRPEPA